MQTSEELNCPLSQAGRMWPSIHIASVAVSNNSPIGTEIVIQEASRPLRWCVTSHWWFYWCMLCKRLNSRLRHLTYTLSILFSLLPLHVVSGQFDDLGWNRCHLPLFPFHPSLLVAFPHFPFDVSSFPLPSGKYSYHQNSINIIRDMFLSSFSNEVITGNF